MSSPRQPATAIDAEVLLSHGAWLAALARALVAREDEVDDVVQQTYVRALEQPPRHAGNVKGWLGTVARNVVGMNRRSETARVAREVAVPLPPPVETPHEAVERAELRRMVVESVLALDEPQRSAVILRFFEERDVADIARLTAANEETVRTRLRRGVERVRRDLERKVDAGTGDAAREGVAARALLFVRLREIAASGGGGGASGSAAASRGLARAGRGSAARLSARAIGLGVAAVAIVGFGGWAWWNAPQRETVDESGSSRAADTAAAAPTPRPEAGVVVAERTVEEGDAARATSPSSPVAPPRADRGTIHGVVMGPDGAPVAGAHVWAIPSRSHERAFALPEFSRLAIVHVAAPPGTPPPGPWVVGRCDAQGRFEFSELSLHPGWAIGACDPALGAGITDVLALDRAHREIAADVRIWRGVRVRGVVTDEDGSPVGAARLFLDLKHEPASWRIHGFSEAVGPRVGQFEFDYFCADRLEFACSTPTFFVNSDLKIQLTKSTRDPTVTVVLKRRPGVVVRGAIVDPAGDPVDFAALLDEHALDDDPHLRWNQFSLWAIAEGTPPPEVLLPTMKAKGVIEGRVDFAKSAYEVVVPETWKGTVELRFNGACVGAADLDEPREPAGLECNEERFPARILQVPFTAQFVDATTKAPIDLRDRADAPVLIVAERPAPTIPSGCDLARGVIQYRCARLPARVEASLQGYAASRFAVVIPSEPERMPPTFELPPATSRLRGVALHADGRPFAGASISVHRRTPSGWVDATGLRTVTNGDGEFEFESLADGEHAVVARGVDEAPAVARFFATASTADVELRTGPGRRVQLRLILEPGGRDLPPYVDVRILSRDGIELLQVDNDVAFVDTPSLDSLKLTLEDGRYTVVVQRVGVPDTRVDFDVPQESVEVRLPPASDE